MLMFKKPKGMKYTDMCIFIDNNIYTENPDYDTIYRYMVLIAYMLASKQKYFSTAREYEDFAAYLAYSTFQRMTCKDKGKIKSVLNYMKSILYFRKAAFNEQNYQEIMGTEYDNWDSIAYAEKCKSSLESSNRQKLQFAVENTLESIPSQIDKYIPKNFKKDKQTRKNIYISSLLSILNKFTLPAVAEEHLEEKLNTIPTFNEVKYFRNHMDDSIILWHLPLAMESVVKVVVNKVDNYLIDEIKYITQDSIISDDEYNNIIATNFTAGGANETDN